MVEEFINPEFIVLPPDYKFYDVDGKVRFCHFIYDRGFDPKEQDVNVSGDDLNTALYPSFKLGHDYEKPKEWKEMIYVAERIGDGIKCVRVDLFNINGRIVVGEITF